VVVAAAAVSLLEIIAIVTIVAAVVVVAAAAVSLLEIVTIVTVGAEAFCAHSCSNKMCSESENSTTVAAVLPSGE